MLDGVFIAGDNNVLDGVDTTVGQLDHLIQDDEGSLQLKARAKLVTPSIVQFPYELHRFKAYQSPLSVPLEPPVPGAKPIRPKFRQP